MAGRATVLQLPAAANPEAAKERATSEVREPSLSDGASVLIGKHRSRLRSRATMGSSIQISYSDRESPKEASKRRIGRATYESHFGLLQTRQRMPDSRAERVLTCWPFVGGVDFLEVGRVLEQR
jgi:hypothetical protein